MLLDFEEILEERGKDRERYESATGKDLRDMMPRLLSLLMRHQYLYGLDRGVGVAMRVLDYPALRTFVENYFATAGYSLEYDEADMWAGLFPHEEIQTRLIAPTLPKDLTVLLLLCANVFAKDQQDVQLDERGCSECYVDELFDEYATLVGAGAPGSFRKSFEQNIKELKAKNIIDYIKGGTTNDDRLLIRPMILRVVGTEYQARLDTWLENWVDDGSENSIEPGEADNENTGERLPHVHA